ncbi:Polyketide cyclase / dehydrase and lipid transport [Amycolatopsis xylanica]|uniref:Polyketide cyclase / dehydrase and lipid transport n=1 Tax=Amycolatopsis xylanica TaxID=589385 RepID=A0A1H3PHM3_9PSEU|nr:SRPBCC family protein [Amycolatopsis xylanica]SDZ00453.1 Polyketide cyclase / dehydrase and lipid transport [Amycolatopsis xylanica]
MAVGEATTVVARPAAEILDFIMDVEAYRAVDPRLKTIKWVKREPGITTFRFRPKLMGLPGPMTTQRVALTPGERVNITPVPSAMDRVAGFAGLLECTADGSGTRVRRRLEFTFAKPFSWLMDPLLNRWLAKDVPAELARLKAHLES